MTAFKLDILPNYQNNFRHIFTMKTLTSGHHQPVRVLTLQWLQFLFSYILVLIYTLKLGKLSYSIVSLTVTPALPMRSIIIITNTVEYIIHKLTNAFHLNDSEVYLPVTI